jgi:hypothetical protein
MSAEKKLSLKLEVESLFIGSSCTLAAARSERTLTCTHPPLPLPILGSANQQQEQQFKTYSNTPIKIQLKCP